MEKLLIVYIDETLVYATAERDAQPLIKAFVLMWFTLNEAFQFDWSCESTMCASVYAKFAYTENKRSPFY